MNVVRDSCGKLPYTVSEKSGNLIFKIEWEQCFVFVWHLTSVETMFSCTCQR